MSKQKQVLFEVVIDPPPLPSNHGPRNKGSYGAVTLAIIALQPGQAIHFGGVRKGLATKVSGLRKAGLVNGYKYTTRVIDGDSWLYCLPAEGATHVPAAGA